MSLSKPAPESAAAAWGAVLTSTDPLTDQTIASAALGLTLGERKEFRDTLLAWMTSGVLDLELTAGQMSASTKAAITEVMNTLPVTLPNARRLRVWKAVYLVMTSPEYVVQR